MQKPFFLSLQILVNYTSNPFQMNYTIFGDEITINTPTKILGSAFLVTGKNCPKLGLPNGFLFQAPDKFAPPVEESINQYGLLTNTFPVTNGMNVLSEHLIDWMRNRRQE